MSKTRKPIGTTFKKENIFLATVDYPMTPDEADYFMEEKELDFFKLEEGDILTVFDERIFYNLICRGGFIRQEFDIFYKDENGYTRFFAEGNETFAGDNSDGKGKLYNIVPACEYYRGYELVEDVDDKGEPTIVDLGGQRGNNPIYLYNKDYNLKPNKENN